IPDDIEEVQRIKTVLLRNTLDNIYWQNNLQPIVQNDSVENPESVTNPRFGEPIRVKSGKSVADAVGYSTVPFVAAQS
ncbi:portal protein, partial [Serratia liquefaciens]